MACVIVVVGLAVLGGFHAIVFGKRESVAEQTRTDSPAQAEHFPVFRLYLSLNDQLHFRQLMELHGTALFARQNRWRKAFLSVGGGDYKVSLRLHGRAPSGHGTYPFTSYVVRLQAGERIFNSNSFRLIVYDRIGAFADFAVRLGQEFKVAAEGTLLVRCAVNDAPSRLYHFERSINDVLMEVEGRPSARRLSSDRVWKTDYYLKSLVVTTNIMSREPYDVRREIDSVLELPEFPAHFREPVRSRYNKLADAIAKRDGDALVGFFDWDYLVRWEALRLLLGMSSHGSWDSNIYLFLDTATGLFYPVLTRDHFIWPFTGPSQLELLSARNQDVDCYLLMTFARSERLRLAKSAYLHELLADKKRLRALMVDLIAIVQRHLATPGSNWRVDGPVRKRRQELLAALVDNTYAIRSFLGFADVTATLRPTASGASIQVETIWPGGGRLEYLQFQCTHVADGAKVRALVSVTTPRDGQLVRVEKEGEYPVRGGMVDVARALEGVTFIDQIDRMAYATDGEYQIDVVIEGGEAQFERMGFADLRTGKEVLPRILAQSNVAAEKGAVAKRITSSAAQEVRLPLAPWPLSVHSAGVMHIAAGSYELKSTLVVPEGNRLVVEAGVALGLAPGVSVVCRGGLEIAGTAEQPVRIYALDETKPFGSLAVLGGRKHAITIRYLVLEGGGESAYEGALFSGALAIHDSPAVQIRSSSFSGCLAEDAVNIKYCRDLVIEDCRFQDNRADHLDVDVSHAVIRSCQFLQSESAAGANGDGVDFSRSRVVLSECKFVGLGDKAISVGEASWAFVARNRIQASQIGLAVKDGSVACAGLNRWDGNTIDVAAYRKKRFYQGGCIVLAIDRSPGESLTTRCDRISEVVEVQGLRALGIVTSGRGSRSVDWLGLERVVARRAPDWLPYDRTAHPLRQSAHGPLHLGP